MTQLIDKVVPALASDLDLATAVQHVLERSPEPLTPARIRAALPSAARARGADALAECLERLAAATVLIPYPRYRSPQARYWDRPMRVHVAQLVRDLLRDRPLAPSELRRKLPPYARSQLDDVLAAQVAQGLLHRHPPPGSRGVARFGLQPPDARAALRPELQALFARLEQQGFPYPLLCQAALDLLREYDTPVPTPPLPNYTWAEGLVGDGPAE